MLCQLSYRGLTTTRLRTLAASSAYVVFRSHLLHRLINSCLYASGLPAQPASQRAMPGDGTAATKIATGGDDHSALSSEGDEPFDRDRCRNTLAKQLGKPTRLGQLQRSASRCLARGGIAHPSQLLQFGIPAPAFNLMPTEMLPPALAAIREGGQAGDAEPCRCWRPRQDSRWPTGLDRERRPPRVISLPGQPTTPGPPG
jgi:hypothetical protein